MLSDKLLYGRSFYLYLMVSNLALRFAWTYKFTALHRVNGVVMIFTLLEAFRWVPRYNSARVPGWYPTKGGRSGFGIFTLLEDFVRI